MLLLEKIIIDQIKAQLNKLIPVHNLIDISELNSFIGKELILIKLNVKKNSVSKIYEFIKKHGAQILFDNKGELIIEFSGTPSEISEMTTKLNKYNIIEMTRSGLVSMALGTEYIRK